MNDANARFCSFFGVVLSYSVMIAIQRLLRLAGSIAELSGTAANVFGIAAYIAAVGAAIAVMRVGNFNFSRSFRLPETLAATACMICASVIFSLIGFGTQRGTTPMLISAAAGILVKPPLEEILFRGLYINALTAGAQLPGSAAIAAQAVLFAAWHPSSARPTALAAGVILGILSHKVRKVGESTADIGSAVSAHALYNAVMYASAAV